MSRRGPFYSNKIILRNNWSYLMNNPKILMRRIMGLTFNE